MDNGNLKLSKARFVIHSGFSFNPKSEIENPKSDCFLSCIDRGVRFLLTGVDQEETEFPAHDALGFSGSSNVRDESS